MRLYLESVQIYEKIYKSKTYGFHQMQDCTGKNEIVPRGRRT